MRVCVCVYNRLAYVYLCKHVRLRLSLLLCMSARKSVRVSVKLCVSACVRNCVCVCGWVRFLARVCFLAGGEKRRKICDVENVVGWALVW